MNYFWARSEWIIGMVSPVGYKTSVCKVLLFFLHIWLEELERSS